MASTRQLKPLAESLAKSVEDRAEMLRKFGAIPASILKINRGAESRALFNLAQERAAGIGGADSMRRIDAFTTDAGKEKARERRAAGIFGGIREASDMNNRASVSVMPAELVSFFVRYYSAAGELYLDPFAGHGVRLQVAARLGLRYIGYDVCAEYVRFVRAVVDRLPEEQRKNVEIVEADSRTPALDDGIGDFCFTSPPYWDVEFYGPEAAQLGTGKSYDDFLAAMRDVWTAWRPKFRAGAYVVVNVNDLRRSGRFYSYHSDTIALMRAAGFTHTDVWIVDGLVSGLVKAFAVNRNAQKIAPKVHEYALVFRA